MMSSGSLRAAGHKLVTSRSTGASFACWTNDRRNVATGSAVAARCRLGEEVARVLISAPYKSGNPDLTSGGGTQSASSISVDVPIVSHRGPLPIFR